MTQLHPDENDIESMAELNRQIKMAWERGHTLGTMKGFLLAGVVFAILFVVLIIKIFINLI